MARAPKTTAADGEKKAEDTAAADTAANDKSEAAAQAASSETGADTAGETKATSRAATSTAKPSAKGKAADGPEEREFVATRRILHDGALLSASARLSLTEAQHARLFATGAVLAAWAEGETDGAGAA